MSRRDVLLSLGHTRAECKALRILVVDDNPAFARVLRSVILERGHLCDAFETIPSAVQAVARGAYDAVVSDKHLARGDGTEFLREVAWRSPRTARVLMSGAAPGTGIDPALVHAYLLKPFDPESLFSIVEGFGPLKLVAAAN
jgi:DNA-binding NtrC family response regulator